MEKKKKLTNKEFNKLSYNEKIVYCTPKTPDFGPPPALPEQEELGFKTETTEFKKYHCMCHNKGFDTRIQLSRHNRAQLNIQRHQAGCRPQLVPPPTIIPKLFKWLTVQHMGISTRIASTYFLPPNWLNIKVYEPVRTGKGIWVYMEPIEMIKDE